MNLYSVLNNTMKVALAFFIVLLTFPMFEIKAEVPSPQGEWATGATITTTGFQYRDMTADAAGNIYIAQSISGQNSILKYDQSGNLLTSWAPYETQPFPDPPTDQSAIANTRELVYGGDGNIYVFDIFFERIVKFDTSGNYLDSLRIISGENDLGALNTLGVDNSGNLILGYNSSRNFMIKRMTITGTVLNQWNSINFSTFEVSQIRYDAFNNRVLVSNGEDIEAFTTTGGNLGIVYDGGFFDPAPLTFEVDRFSGNIYRTFNTVRKYNSNFKQVAQFGGPDAGDTTPVPGGNYFVYNDVTGEIFEYGPFAYQIENLNFSFDVRNSLNQSVKFGSANGIIGNDTLRLIANGNPNIVYAEFDANLSSDSDWMSQVSAGNDTVLGKAFVHNLVSAETSTSSYDLYIPKQPSDTNVYVCPNATNLTEVNSTCPGQVVFSLTDAGPKTVGTAVGVTASTTSVGGQNYWVISGVNGTGGQSVFTTTALRDTMTRQAVSVESDHAINAGFAITLDQPGDTFTVNFNDDFDLSSIVLADIELIDDLTTYTTASVPGADTWGVTIDVVNSEIVFTAPTSGTSYIDANSVININIGLNAGGTNQIVNPATPGTYDLQIEIDALAGQGNATIFVPIMDDDGVEITGFIQDLIAFDIDTTTDISALTLTNCDATGGALPCDGHGNPIAAGQFDAVGYTVSLGNLISTDYNESGDTVVHQDGNTGQINTIGIDLSANLNGGVFVTVESLNNALDSSGNQIATPTAGTTVDLSLNGGYGLRVFDSNAVLGTIVPSVGYGGGAGIFGGLDTSGGQQAVFGSNNSYLDQGRILLSVGARTLGTEPVGTYTDSLTLTATPQF